LSFTSKISKNRANKKKANQVMKIRKASNRKRKVLIISMIATW
jgi:hypothetical protein